MLTPNPRGRVNRADVVFFLMSRATSKLLWLAARLAVGLQRAPRPAAHRLRVAVVDQHGIIVMILITIWPLGFFLVPENNVEFMNQPN